MHFPDMRLTKGQNNSLCTSVKIRCIVNYTKNSIGELGSIILFRYCTNALQKNKIAEYTNIKLTSQVLGIEINNEKLL